VVRCKGKSRRAESGFKDASTAALLTAVGVEDLARHEVGVARRGEENITRSALGRLTRSVDERNSSGTVVLDLVGRSGSGLTEEEDERKWVVSRVGKNGRGGRGKAHVQRRVDGAWRDSVDTDALGSKLD
jgi:hypothetical protein